MRSLLLVAVCVAGLSAQTPETLNFRLTVPVIETDGARVLFAANGRTWKFAARENAEVVVWLPPNERAAPVVQPQTGSWDDWQFRLAVGGLLVATLADAESTVRLLRDCTTCYEKNALLSPFARRRATLYPVMLGLSGLGAWGTAELKKRNQRYWWIIPVAGTAVHLYFTGKNETLRNRALRKSITEKP